MQVNREKYLLSSLLGRIYKNNGKLFLELAMITQYSLLQLVKLPLLLQQ